MEALFEFCSKYKQNNFFDFLSLSYETDPVTLTSEVRLLVVLVYRPRVSTRISWAQVVQHPIGCT